MYEIDSEEIIKAQNNDEEAMTKIIKTNSGLIWSIVKRFLGRGYDKEELEQIAYIGFIKAIKRFDTTLEFKLSTYAVPYIIGEIKRFIRDDGPIKVSRSIKELNVKIQELKKHYLITKGREITIEEIAKELKVDKDDIIIAMESNNSIESIEGTSNQSDKEGKKLSILDKISTGKNEEEIITNKIVIKQLLKELDERDREIILLRFFKEKTQTEVARILGISQVQVSRIERKVLDKMKNKLTSA